jgi:succinate dehydrogenase / fumarate reductase membrane anchor subunit
LHINKRGFKLEKIYESKLSRVKGLGSGGDPVHHWWLQRVTAIANIFLVLWLVSVLAKTSKISVSDLLGVMAEPLSTVIGIVMIISTMKHGVLGMQVVIEDYVPDRTMRNFLLIVIQFAAIFTAVAGICALLYNHVTYFRI